LPIHCLPVSVRVSLDEKMGRRQGRSESRKMPLHANLFPDSSLVKSHAATADIGLKADKGKLAQVHGTILKRVEEHSNSAKMQGSMAGFSGGAREQLQGGGIAKGGLIKASGDKPVFKKPASMLGLQALAAKKRAEEGR